MITTGVSSGQDLADEINSNSDAVKGISRIETEAGKNKFDKTVATDGAFITNDGNTTINAAFVHSDFIPVIVGTQYKSTNNMVSTCYYDSSFVVVAGGAAAGSTTFTTPVGVSFIIISMLLVDKDTQQLEIGTVATVFEEYIDVVTETSSSLLLARTSDTYTQSEIDTLLDELADQPKIGELTTFTDGFVLDSNGDPAVNASWSYSDYLPVSAGIYFYSLGQFGRGSLYDGEKNFVREITVEAVENFFFTVEKGEFFVRMNTQIVNQNIWVLSKNYDSKYILNPITSDEIPIFPVSKINEYVLTETVTGADLLEGVTLTTGFYYDDDVLIPLASFSYTDTFIPVSPNSNYAKSLGAQFSGGFYTVDKTFIKNITLPDDVNARVTTPKNCYFILLNVANAETNPYFRLLGFNLEGLLLEPVELETPDVISNDNLTADYSYLEKTNLLQIDTFDFERYFIQGNICVIGDSIIDGILGAVKVSSLLNATGTKTDIAHQGDDINDQLILWNALSGAVQSAMDYVFIQVGLNDTDYTEAASVAMTRYQGLVDQIRLDTTDCIIVTGAMTPARQVFINADGAVNGAIAWQKVLDMNESIMGGGGFPITDTDLVTDTHFHYLRTSVDNLRLKYDVGDFIHPTTKAKKIIAHSWLSVIV